MTGLAVAQANRGKHEVAENMHRQALTLREEVFGPEQPEALRTMDDLAFTLCSQGKSVTPEKMYDEILERRGEIQPLEHINIQATVSDIAVNCRIEICRKNKRSYINIC